MRIYKEEGVLAFGKGIVPRVAWMIPGLSISMTVYESLKKGWRKRID